MARHLTVIIITLLAVFLAKNRADGSSTTAKPGTTQNIEDPETEKIVRAVANDIVRHIEKDPRAKEDWNYTFTGDQLADLVKPLHKELLKKCKSKLPNTLVDVIDGAIRRFETDTFEEYWTVVFRVMMKLAIYDGKKITYDSGKEYLKYLQDELKKKEVKDLIGLFYEMLPAFDKFVKPHQYCENTEALAVLYLRETEVYN